MRLADQAWIRTLADRLEKVENELAALKADLGTPAAPRPEQARVKSSPSSNRQPSQNSPEQPRRQA